VLDVAEVVESVDIDSCDLDFVSWSGGVDEVMNDEYFFLARDSAGRDSSWSLLDRELLVISVDCVRLINSEGAPTLTDQAGTQLLLSCVLVVAKAWSFNITALTSEVDLLILRVNSGSLGNNTPEFNQSVQVNLAEFTKLVFDWETANSHEDLVVDEVVLGEDLRHDVTCHLVKDWEHPGWLLCKPDCEGWLLAGQVGEVDLERLSVPLAHALDAVFVHGLAGLLVSERPEEGAELAADEVDDFLLLDPLGEWPLGVSVVVHGS